jgi:hypothetical protein
LFNAVVFFPLVAEVTIKQLKEKLREYDEKMEANAQVSVCGVDRRRFNCVLTSLHMRISLNERM